MKIKNIVQLQLVVIIYTIASVMSKLSTQNKDSIECILFLGLDFVFLGVYALLWQQMIKKFDLTVAYANRAMAIIWSMLWAVIFFHDSITIKNIIGVIIVLIGTLLVNMDSASDTGVGGKDCDNK